MEKKRRDDKKNVFNSPLNFIYITKDSNQKISNHQVEYYVKYCNDNSVYDLYCYPLDKFEQKQPVSQTIEFKYHELTKEDFLDSVGMYL